MHKFFSGIFSAGGAVWLSLTVINPTCKVSRGLRLTVKEGVHAPAFMLHVKLNQGRAFIACICTVTCIAYLISQQHSHTWNIGLQIKPRFINALLKIKKTYNIKAIAASFSSRWTQQAEVAERCSWSMRLERWSFSASRLSDLWDRL